MRNYKSLDDVRRDREKKRDSVRMLDFRLGMIAVVLFIIAVQETSFPTGYFIFASFLLIIVLIARLVMRNLRKNKANPNEEPFFDMNRQESINNARPDDIYSMEPSGGYVKSKSFADYQNVADPWDIKDPKPPWEL